MLPRPIGEQAKVDRTLEQEDPISNHIRGSPGWRNEARQGVESIPHEHLICAINDDLSIGAFSSMRVWKKC